MPEEIDPSSPDLGSEVTSPETTDVITDSSSEAEPSGPSVLDSVKEALAKQKADGGEPLKPQPQEPAANAADPAKAGDEDGDLTPDEFKRLNKKTQKRIQTVISERDKERGRAEAFTQKAKSFDEIQTFFRNGGHTPEQVVEAIEFVKNLAANPDAAWEYVVKQAKVLAEHKGLILSPQLEDQVAKGFITREYAQQLAAAQNVAKRATDTLEQRSQNARQAQEQYQQQQLVQMGTQTATAWEAEKARADPDWKLKQPRVFSLIENHLLKNGSPKTPQDVRQLCEAALKRVDEEMKGFRPVPKAVTAIRGAASQRDGAPQPKTALEAAKLALAR